MGYKSRITIENVSGGQERAYGPTTNILRVAFERMSPYGDNAEEWMPNTGYVESTVCGGTCHDKEVRERVMNMLDKLSIGFTAKTKQQVEWYETYLVYMHQVTPGVWEFKTQHEFTD